jgi:hypothetical protein
MKSIVGFTILTAVLTKVATFWNIVPCSSYTNQRCKVTYHFHLQGRNSAGQGTNVLAVGLVDFQP